MIASERWLIERAAELLEERLGIPTSTSARQRGSRDQQMRIELSGSPIAFSIRAKNAIWTRDVDALALSTPEDGEPVLLVAPSLPPRIRERLRAAGINHMDLAGRVFIHEPSFYVSLDADRDPPPVPRFQNARSPNPFSKKASLVLRALLEHPEKHWGVRELGGETGLSIGHASEIVRALVRRGYAAEQGVHFVLRDPVAALRDWLAVYDWTKNARQSFVVPFEHEEVVSRLCGLLEAEQATYALTLLAGASFSAPHVQHEQTHVYVAEKDAAHVAELVTMSLYAEPATTGGNLHLLLPYYRAATFYGSRRFGETTVAPPVQLFLDLAGYPLRGAEAARMMVKGPLAKQLGLDGPQVRALTSELE